MSSGSGDSSEVTSDDYIYDDVSCRTGKEKVQFRKFQVHLENIGGDVVVGGQSAQKFRSRKKKGGEDHGLPKPSSNTNQPSAISAKNSFSKESSKHERAEQRYTRFIQSGEYIPGSYCQTTCDRRQNEQEKETWNPKPDKCIFKSKGDRKFPWTIPSFMDSPDRFIQDMHRSDGLSKERREEFILHVILKHLEGYWGGCSSANEKVYRILGKIMSVDSNIVFKHTLHLLFHLICKDNLSNDTRNLMLVEKNLRTSLFSSEKGFERDLNAEQNFQLMVYGRVLSLLLVQRVRQQNLPTTTLEEDLTKVQEDVRKCCTKVENKRKDEFRYSLEFIDRMISLLLTPHDKLTAATKLNDFLKESEDFFINQTTDHTKRLKILDTYRKKKSGEWCVLHCILIFLHGEVQSERSVRQKETGRRAMILLRLIIETFLNEGDGAGDWRFCLLASSILAHIAMNNETIEIMKEAGSGLVNLLKNLVKMDKGRTRLECRTIVERRALQLFFCPHSKTRTLLVNFLLNTLDVQDVVSADLHINHLMSCSEYRAQSLEISNDKIHTGQNCFIHKGMFQRRKVAIKMLWVTKQHLLEEDPKFRSRARLIQEAYNLTRLNNSQHFPNLLACNTKDLPYHLVTDHETSGDLLHFLRESRKSIIHLPSVRLLKMVIDVINGLLYLQEKCLVHRAVMAENVLVGESYVCKLSGLYALKKLSYGTSQKGATSAETYDYCSADDGVPVYISADDEHEELPVRWKAPECITKHRYSTASDTWAFGIFMYEVFTHGCIPYKHISDNKEVASYVVKDGGIVPHETCIEEKKFELIKKCCESEFHKRKSLIELKESLQNMLNDADEKEPGPEPPSWGFENQQDEEIYSVIPGKEEYLLQKGDCPFIKEDKGSIWICERITKLDIKHLKSLKKLNNPNLANILIKHWDSHSPMVEITSEASALGNLKDYVVKRDCRQESIVTFLSQVASALHYLHTKHIVHGDLRAMYVTVVSPDKVQVGRLGRSKSLSPSSYEVTSKSCGVKAEMPSDASRWSAPEVNLDGYYTHASDVWAFGILAWELYVSFISGEDLQPYYRLQEDKILMHMRHKGSEGQLERPEGCPDWVYILMHQCWAYDFAQRPPFLAIFDCLTSREPMKSWIMELWLQNHKENEWPLELSICQQNAVHVTNAKRDYTTEDIERMCPVSFFAKHNYKYVETASASHSVDDECYASCSSEGGSLDRRLEYHDITDGRINATFFRDTGECRGGYEEPIVSTYCETSGEKKGIESCQNAFTVPLNPKSQTEAPFYESVDLPLSNEQLLAPMHKTSAVSRGTTTTITRTSVAEKTDGCEKSLKTMPNGSSSYLSPLEKYSDGGNLSKSLPVKEGRSSSLFYSSTDVSPSTRSHSVNFKGCSADANRPMGGMGRIEAQPTSKHNYKYVETASASYGVDDEYYASCSSEGGSLDRRLEYHDTTDGRISATFFRDTGECRGGYEEPIVSTYCETSGEKKGTESCQNAFTVPLKPKSQTEAPFYESVDLPLSNEQLLAPMHNKSAVSRGTTTTITRTSVAEKTDGCEKSLKTMPNGSSSYLSPLEKYSDGGNLSKSLPVKEGRSSSLFYSSTDVSPSTRSHSVNFKGGGDDANRPMGGMGRIEAQPTSKHNYKYVETASASYGVDDEYYASCSSEGGSLDRRLEYHDTTDGRISATFFRDTGECRGGYEEPIVSTYCETSGEKKGIESCQNAFTVPLNPKSQTENPLYESVDLPLSNEQLLAPMHNKSIVSRDTAKTITRTSVAEKTEGFEKSLKTMPNGSSSYLSPLEKYSDRGNLSKSLPVKESRSSSLFYSSTDVSPSTRSHSVNFKGCSDDANRPMGGMGRIEAQPTSIANASDCSNPENMKCDVPSTPIKLKNTTLRDPCSVEKTKSTKRTKRNWTDSVHYSSVELVGSTLNCENGNSSKTENSATYAGLHECCSAEYQVLISNLSNVESHKSEAENDYDDVLDEDQTIMKNKDDYFIYDDVISFPVNGGEVVNSGFNKKDDSLIADYPNRAVRLEQKNVSDNPQRDAKEDMNTAQYQKVKSLDHDGNSMNGKIQQNSLDNKHLRQCQNKTEVASGAVCPISTKMPQRAEHNSDPRESGQSMAGPVNQEDDVVRYKLQRNTASNEHTFINNYENFSCDLDQGDNSNSMRRNTERREGYNKYVDCETESQFSSNQSNARNCSYENATYYLATPPSQLSKGARKISSGSQAKRKSKSCQKRHKEKTDADRASAVEDMHSTSERPMQNQSLMARLNDPELNIIQF